MAKRARSQTEEDTVAIKALNLEATVTESRDGTDMEGESVFVVQRQPIDLLTFEKMASY